MSSTDSEFPVALTELQQVSATISQGANFFESQINSGQPAARYFTYYGIRKSIHFTVFCASDASKYILCATVAGCAV